MLQDTKMNFRWYVSVILHVRLIISLWKGVSVLCILIVLQNKLFLFGMQWRVSSLGLFGNDYKENRDLHWVSAYLKNGNLQGQLYATIGSLVGFYGISTIVGYLMPNPLFTYILNIYMIRFSLVLWHINHYRLSNVKSSLYIYIKYISFGLIL